MPRVAANPAVPMQMDVKPKPDWLNKIQSGEIQKKKISNEVLKRRRNHRLANLLKPKAPINVLAELTKQGEVTFEKAISDQVSRLIKVSALYDSKLSKVLALQRTLLRTSALKPFCSTLHSKLVRGMLLRKIFLRDHMERRRLLGLLWLVLHSSRCLMIGRLRALYYHLCR